MWEAIKGFGSSIASLATIMKILPWVLGALAVGGIIYLIFGKLWRNQKAWDDSVKAGIEGIQDEAKKTAELNKKGEEGKQAVEDWLRRP